MSRSQLAAYQGAFYNAALDAYVQPDGKMQSLLGSAAGYLHGAANAYSATYAAVMAQSAAMHLQAQQAYSLMNAMSAQAPTIPNRRSVITRMGFGGGREKRFRSLDREAA
jgi:hypothetical protein